MQLDGTHTRGGGSGSTGSGKVVSAVPMGSHPSNGKVLEVYLTRAGKVDGMATNNKIPYVTINSLTLIAALRLGLVSSQRSEAYQGAGNNNQPSF